MNTPTTNVLEEKLLDAIMFSRHDDMGCLIESGANVNADDGYPLFLAILNADEVAISMLRQNGAFCLDLGIKPETRPSIER